MIKKKQRNNFNSIESSYCATPELIFPSLLDKDFDMQKDLNICDKRYAELNAQEKFARKFWNKFKMSKNIIIIDGFCDEINFDIINLNIQKDAKLQIYTSCKRNKIAQNILPKINHENTFIYHLKNDIVIHDRYAILDDELFHFGSTVGGFVNHFTAYSRGWKKEQLSGLIEFLERSLKNSNHIEEIKKHDR